MGDALRIWTRIESESVETTFGNEVSLGSIVYKNSALLSQASRVLNIDEKCAEKDDLLTWATDGTMI